MDFKTPKFRKGEMVRWHFQPEKSLGIVMEQDAGKVKVHWVISPRLQHIDVWIRGAKPLSATWYPIYKIQRVEPIERRFSEAN